MKSCTCWPSNRFKTNTIPPDQLHFHLKNTLTSKDTILTSGLDVQVTETESAQSLPNIH